MPMKMLRKITAKTVMGPISKPAKFTDLFNVYGRATGTKAGMDTQYGKSLAITGRFEAVNLQTGEMVQAPQVYLPEPFHSMTIGALEQDPRPAHVDFALKISVQPSDKGSMGYEYVCTPLVEPAADDSMQEMRKLCATNAPALAPPTKSSDTATKKTAAKKK